MASVFETHKDEIELQQRLLGQLPGYLMFALQILSDCQEMVSGASDPERVRTELEEVKELIGAVLREFLPAELPPAPPLSSLTMFDWLHMQHFDTLYGLDEEGRKQLAAFARQHGATEEDIAIILSGLIRKGMTFGHAHTVDVMSVVERTLDVQRAKSATLKISRESDEDHHLTIEVVEVVRQNEKPRKGEERDERNCDDSSAH